MIYENYKMMFFLKGYILTSLNLTFNLTPLRLQTLMPFFSGYKLTVKQISHYRVGHCSIDYRIEEIYNLLRERKNRPTSKKIYLYYTE